MGGENTLDKQTIYDFYALFDLLFIDANKRLEKALVQKHAIKNRAMPNDQKQHLLAEIDEGINLDMTFQALACQVIIVIIKRHSEVRDDLSQSLY